MSSNIEQAVEYAKRALVFDQRNQFDAAIIFYKEAAEALLRARNVDNVTLGHLEGKITEYIERAETLLQNAKASNANNAVDGAASDCEKAYFMLSQALDVDEAGEKEEAVDLYAQAVELCLKARKSTKDPALLKKLQNNAAMALERAEKLKGLNTPVSPPKVETAPVSDAMKSVSIGSPVSSRGNLHRGFSKHLQVVGGEGYTKQEIETLRSTSVINSRTYVPFMDVDLKERFAFPLPFTDKDGLLSLSPKQKSKLARWARPEEFCSSTPKLIEVINPFSIKQTVVSDCSFVASLAITALYERRFRQRVITSIIYPKNKAGEPVYNPCGKYMIKLKLNGVSRKVVIDDLLPLDRHGELLCSFSSCRNELWVSLLEKAYMKVMGGYDFPGSNSNIDLHALTGWIPERMAIRLGEKGFDETAAFDKIFERFHAGDVLVTLATGFLNKEEEERTGLVATHAYALLDIRKVKGVKLLQLKNPWSHVRWKGNYSELDLNHWTPDLREALKFDPDSAANFDNGVFWIDYESVLRFYDVFYLSWNPSLFKYTFSTHETWRREVGPAKDHFTLASNPQFSLELKGGSAGAVWVLLTRHITDVADFKDNREYITLTVYKNGGRKMYYPDTPKPFIRGACINSPHYLAKILVGSDVSGDDRKFTLVMSQYEKTTTTHYTLRAYSTLPFDMRKISSEALYRVKQDVTGLWKGLSAGGCGNHRETYPNNPRYQLSVEGGQGTPLLLELKGPKEYSVGMDILPVEVAAEGGFPRRNSGAFRSGYVYLEVENLPPGTYHVVVSTYLPGQEGPYILTCHSASPVKLARVN
ncbi:unnamed protein product [Cyprideis torosa]|uniref:Uncharacterized protein n=1 Tax=Cyprideis torosa TaxID=163714 RepID=A0A7R8W7K4_9CRUS|nr:unnamed protein product [Cyprideis torosa]CAG0887662.1 unnamed protein product [Cyprideis torosa]